MFLLLALSYHIARELEIIYVSALFAVVVMPGVKKITALNLRGYRPSNAVAVMLILFVTAVAAAIFITIGLPPVLRDMRSFMTELPQRMPAFEQHVKNIPLAQEIGLGSLAAKAESLMGEAGTYVVGSLPKWLSHVFDVLTAIFLCIYFILEGDYAYEFFLSLFAAGDRRRLDVTLRKADLKMSKWLLGQGLLMLCMGITFTLVFWGLHVRYFVLLGVMMGVFNIIPIAGGAITITLAMIVASIDSWQKAVGVLIAYLIYVNIENAVLTPRIMRSSLNMMGLTVLVALLIGTAVAGIVGALVAVPTAALISELLDEYAVKR